MFLLLCLALATCLVAIAFTYHFSIQIFWRQALVAPPPSPRIRARDYGTIERIRALVDNAREMADWTSDRISEAERRLHDGKRLRDVSGALALFLCVGAGLVGWSPLGGALIAASVAASVALGIAVAQVEHNTDQVRKLREALSEHERDAWVWQKEYEQSAPALAAPAATSNTSAQDLLPA